MPQDARQNRDQHPVGTVLLLVGGMFLLVTGATLVVRNTPVGVLLLLAGQVLFLVNVIRLLRRRGARRPGADGREGGLRD